APAIVPSRSGADRKHPPPPWSPSSGSLAGRARIAPRRRRGGDHAPPDTPSSGAVL
ncbi:MAG: hypothetical protein AVDCRST_MAG73-705, partial [uncultured Thermomicrobiales bacterium]